MQLLEERIRKDGIIKEGNVLKVDRFLNHHTIPSAIPTEGASPI